MEFGKLFTENQQLTPIGEVENSLLLESEGYEDPIAANKEYERILYQNRAKELSRQLDKTNENIISVSIHKQNTHSKLTK